jgi:hypothetical protein
MLRRANLHVVKQLPKRSSKSIYQIDAWHKKKLKENQRVRVNEEKVVDV